MNVQRARLSKALKQGFFTSFVLSERNMRYSRYRSTPGL